MTIKTQDYTRPDGLGVYIVDAYSPRQVRDNDPDDAPIKRYAIVASNAATALEAIIGEPAAICSGLWYDYQGGAWTASPVPTDSRIVARDRATYDHLQPYHPLQYASNTDWYLEIETTEH